jgi:hypothetical protein
VISAFSLEVHEIYALLGRYAAYGGNSLPKFRGSLSGPSLSVKADKESPLYAA